MNEVLKSVSGFLNGFDWVGFTKFMVISFLVMSWFILFTGSVTFIKQQLAEKEFLQFAASVVTLFIFVGIPIGLFFSRRGDR